MAACCEDSCAIDALREKQGKTLRIVLAINVVLFIVGVTVAVYSASSSVLSDSLDSLGDALTYGLSLFVVSRSLRAKAKVAMFKGSLILFAAIVVVGQLIYRFFVPSVPVFELMGVMSVFALIGNTTCLYLLTRHRDDDVNMSSVWECSRNDMASNIAVFVAAGAVWATNSFWPDVIIAFALVVLFLRSAIRVFTNASRELKATAATS